MSASQLAIQQMSTDELREQIVLIEENLAECGARSSYAERNRPLLRAYRIELERREREQRTDLCDECRDEDHTTCSLNPTCSCCLTTLAAMAEEAP